nr:myosin light chain kinase 3 [Hymenolepis microstoma]
MHVFTIIIFHFRSQIKNVRPLVSQSVTSPTKEATPPQTSFYSDEGVIQIRSIEVSSNPFIGTYSCTEPITLTRDPKTPKPVLRTTCLQAEFRKPSPKSVPPCVSDQRPFLMTIGKVETASLVLASHSVERIDKCTSPLTIPVAVNASQTSSNVLKIEVKQQTTDSPYWYRDDQDSTRLSNQVDLEYDTSLHQSDESLNIESEGLYEPVIKKPAHLPGQDGDLQRSTPVCISKCQSETTQKLTAKGSVEGQSTVTQNHQDGGVVREDEDGNYKWLSVKSNTPSKYQTQPSPSPHQNLLNQKDIQKEGTPTEDTELISRNPNRQLRKPKVKSQPSIILRRNRDIANGVQSPISPYPGSPTSKQVLSKAENGITSTTSRIADMTSSKSIVLDYHQNSTGESCLSIQSNSTDSPGDRNRPISDNDTGGITDVSYYPLTRKLNNKDLEDFNKTGKDLIVVNGNQTSLNSRKSIQVGGSNSSDSSGISLHFTASNSENIPLDMTTASIQMSQEDEQLKELDVPSTKAEIGLISPQPLDFAENSHQMNIKLPNFNGCLNVREESEQGRYSNTRHFILSDLPIEDTIKPDSQVTPRPRLEGNSKKTPVSINRPHNLALGTNYTQTNIVSSTNKKAPLSLELSTLPEWSPSLTPDTFATATGFDRSSVPEKCLKSPKHLHPHTPDPDQTSLCKKSTPKSPVNQIFFPKSVKRPAHSPTGTDASLSKITENMGAETLVSTNSGTNETDKMQDNNAKKIVRSTKLSRSSHVRPQTVSEAPYNESAREIFILHPETHKNVKPDCHFVMHEKVGGGRFGSVFRCENKETHQILAMKEIKTDRLGRHTSGDIMEVAILRAIGHHENIACLYSAYEVQHTCFIITEYVSGGALLDRVVSENNLDEQISASIVRQMLLGLQHIQACSILHLDLKPENIMMVAPTGYRLKIIDFGLAYFYDPKRPRRQMAGTYAYSAPETINYEMQSFATDIWSVAVISYELLAGVTPFECPPPETPDKELTMPEVTTNIINCRYNFDDDGIRDASEKAKDFIRMILKKNPKDRPSVSDCLEHPWMNMTSKLPKIRRTVSISRCASTLEKKRALLRDQFRITVDNERF